MERKKPGYIYFDQTTIGTFQFLWSTPINGYIWDDKAKLVWKDDPSSIIHSPPWLIQTVKFDQARRYSPFEYPDLHRKFAKLWSHSGEEDIKPETMKCFANQWGELGHGKDIYSQGKQVYGESHSQWRSEITHLATLLELWEMVKYERDDVLGKHIRWFRHADGTPGLEFKYTPHRIQGYPMGIEYATWEERKRFEFGEILLPIHHHLFYRINEKLRGHVSPVLFILDEGPCIYMRPDCLLSAMYVLFMLEIAEFKQRKKPPKICYGCGDYFTPSHGRQIYCDENCRWRSGKRKGRSRQPDSKQDKRL